MEAIWNEVKTSIRGRIPGHSYRMWIEPLEFVSCDEISFVLSCPNGFSKKKVSDHYGSLIASEIGGITGKPFKLQLEISGKPCETVLKPEAPRQLILPNMHLRPHSGRMLRRDFTFDQFVVGGNNDFAYSAALSLASGKNARQNTLFLLSSTGMGKSHLSQAIGHYILSESSTERVYYITAEDFSNEMIHAFRHDSLDRFKDKYRKGCDVLLLEDVHYLSGKDRTQVELALALDTLLDSSKKIIFSSCYLPAEIPKLNEGLRSRLSCGIISGIDPPNFRTRIRILQKKAKHFGFDIPDEVIQYLASELTDNVRQLENGLIGIEAKASLLGVRIDLELAASVVKNIASQKKIITIELIKKLVCKHFGITQNDLVSNSRRQQVVRPRQIAIYLSRRYTDSPLQTIGKSFNRYHATALHSIGAVEREMKTNAQVQTQVEYLCRKLETAGNTSQAEGRENAGRAVPAGCGMKSNGMERRDIL